MRPKRARYVVISFIIIAVFVAIWMRMYEMQIVTHDQYQSDSDKKTIRTMTLTGRRGTIYDANLIPLAYDRLSYNVQFYRDPSRTSEVDRTAYTQSIIKTIRLIEANGKKTLTEFWLERDPDDPSKWRFNTGTDVPSVAAKREEQWRKNFYLVGVDTQELYDRLCANYCIPVDDLGEEMTLKVLAIWQLSRMYNFLSMPVVIAEDVGQETLYELEARSLELDGMSVQESSTRVYPKGQTAAHVIGYTSKISGEETLANYLEKGYLNNATVGQTGIEYSMEAQLTPYMRYRLGEQKVEVNNRGKIIREISYRPPIDGDDVILTIDSQLQEVVEQALEENIKKINAHQQSMMNKTNWREANSEQLLAYELAGKEVKLASSGAVVCMDPNTGNILAMASYPTFNLSAFNGGAVSSSYWNELINDEWNPMYNRAISARDTPGSCFKMVTSLAGLMEGVITLQTQITDKGAFDTGDPSHQPRCWSRGSVRASHANQTIIEGIKNSCNYFFYTVGSQLGIEKLVKWSALLGLSSRTGIELPNESTSFVGNQLMLYDSNRAIDRQYTSKPYFASVVMKNRLREVGADRGITYDEDRLNKAAKMILDIVNEPGDKSTWMPKIHKVLLEYMNIPASYIENHFLGNDFQSYINDLRWTPSETVMAAIGQSITQITPVAAARYVSTFANGGTVFDAQIVDKIVSSTGKVVLDKKPVVFNQITGADEYFAAIHEGMRQVTSVENDGTAGTAFAGAAKTYKISAKTGTAQRSKIDLENNSWLVAYAPNDRSPDIVVIVYIQNGYAGAQSADTAVKTIKYFQESKKKSDSLMVPQSNMIAN